MDRSAAVSVARSPACPRLDRTCRGGRRRPRERGRAGEGRRANREGWAQLGMGSGADSSARSAARLRQREWVRRLPGLDPGADESAGRQVRGLRLRLERLRVGLGGSEGGGTCIGAVAACDVPAAPQRPPPAPSRARACLMGGGIVAERTSMRGMRGSQGIRKEAPVSLSPSCFSTPVAVERAARSGNTGASGGERGYSRAGSALR